MFRKEFFDIILKTGLIPPKDLKSFIENKDPYAISEFELLKLDYFDDVKFAKSLANLYKIHYVDLSAVQVSQQVIQQIKKNDILKYRCLPVQKSANGITLTIFDPSVIEKKSELQILLQNPVNFLLTNLSSWQKLFDRVTESIDDIIETIKEVKQQNNEADDSVKEADIGVEVIKYVNRILAEAYIKKASDIHLEPYENDFRVRFRIDGDLLEVSRPNKQLMLPILSRLKIMSQMDISEKRKPQDGRIKLSISGVTVDFRVSSLPTLFGEKIVLRILDKSNLQLDMTKLGFEEKQLKIFKEAISRPYGMCLVTGPTGSGKTTTLYSAIKELNTEDVNISTAEDPVEFNLNGINQVNVRKDIGLTFASTLKSFLRQDPDIIMVGEIRDFETGEIAVEAALTGHLVLSTLHTNDAPSTITRLLNMGIEPFLVTGSLNVVVAQRLCRRICEFCREEVKVSPEVLTSMGIAEKSHAHFKAFKGKGCDRCNQSGYKGRVAIYEVLDIDPKIKELILKGASSDDIKLEAIKSGFKTLRMCALSKVAQGHTTLEEALANSSHDRFKKSN